VNNDPFSQPIKRVRCAECDGTDGAHYVWCPKLDEPKRVHRG